MLVLVALIEDSLVVDMGSEKFGFFVGSWSQIYSIQRRLRLATARDPNLKNSIASNCDN